MKINLNKIQPSKTNPRQSFDKESLKELAENIKTKGLQFPIVVREIGGDTPYELIDGERRWKAAKIAGLIEIEAIVRGMTDEQAVEAQIISFEQDEDIHQLDKAEALKRLMGKTGRPADVAGKIGKPIAYVEKSLRLLTLIEPAQKAFRADVITLGHAILLCRLQPADQKRAFEFAVKSWQEFDGEYGYQNDLNPDADDEKFVYKVEANTVCSVKDLKEFIELRINLNLKQAAFDVKDAALLSKTGSCIDCPKRTGFNKDLFNDIGKGDFCTDGECYRAKQQAFLDRLKSDYKKNKTKYVEITRDRCKPSGHPGALTERSFKYIKGKPCKYARTGIFIDADRKGKTALICAAKKECKQHWGELINSKTKSHSNNSERRISYEETERRRKIAIERARERFEPIVAEIWKNIPGKDIAHNQLIEMLAEKSKEDIAFDLRQFKPQGIKLTNLQVIHLGELCEKYQFDITYEGKIHPDLYKACKELGIKYGPILQKISDEEKAEEKKTKDASKPLSGVCMFCGCTEEKACELDNGESCTWVNKAKTVCSNPECMKQAGEQDRSISQLISKNPKKPAKAKKSKK